MATCTEELAEALVQQKARILEAVEDVDIVRNVDYPDNLVRIKEVLLAIRSVM